MIHSEEESGWMKNGAKHSPLLAAISSRHTQHRFLHSKLRSFLSLFDKEDDRARKLTEEENLSRKIGSRLLLAGSRPLSPLTQRLLDRSIHPSSSHLREWKFTGLPPSLSDARHDPRKWAIRKLQLFLVASSSPLHFLLSPF